MSAWLTERVVKLRTVFSHRSAFTEIHICPEFVSARSRVRVVSASEINPEYSTGRQEIVVDFHAIFPHNNIQISNSPMIVGCRMSSRFFH